MVLGFGGKTSRSFLVSLGLVFRVHGVDFAMSWEFDQHARHTLEG